MHLPQTRALLHCFITIRFRIVRKNSSESVAVGPLAARAKPYFPVLTGIRALAAYIVYFYHFNPFLGKDGASATILSRAIAPNA